MRICLYTDTALPKLGGQEMVVDALARQFLALGHHPIVFAPKPRKLSTNDAIFPYPVVRHPRFFSTQLFISWYRWFLARHYRQTPFDVLHCHGIYPPTYLAALLRSHLPAPVVVTSHGGDVYEHNVRLQKPVVVERCVQGLRAADALVAISRFTREGFTRLCRDAVPRIVDIPNGVHLSAYTERVSRPADFEFALPPKSYAIFLGRLKHRKGVDVLLHAMTRVPEAHLAIVGDGEERAALESLRDQLGLQHRVHFLGMLTGSAKTYVLQNARFGVVPSRQWESFGLVVLEGNASGLPMVATNMPGLADLIQPEMTGLLVPPETPDALAAAMQRLFAGEVLVSRMGETAKKAAAQYDWRQVAERHVELYHKLIQARRKIAA